MQLHRDPAALGRLAPGSAVAVGNFDGVHDGHRAVIEAAGVAARARGVARSVLTFDPHPRAVLRPEIGPFALTPLPARARRIAALGVDHLVAIGFDRAFAAIEPRAFVDDILVGRMAVGHVAIGHDFGFGRGRAGNPETLTAWLGVHGIDVTVVDPVTGPDGRVCSSSAIREALMRGDIATANRALGSPWEVEGEVAHGDARGRQLGFPTANIALGPHLRPAAGVYAVRVGIPERESAPGDPVPSDPAAGVTWHPGVANIGTRPTVDGTDLRLEAHLFDFAGDLYGRVLRVALVEFLRPETRFDGLDKLIAQIEIDCRQAREVLASVS